MATTRKDLRGRTLRKGEMQLSLVLLLRQKQKWLRRLISPT